MDKISLDQIDLKNYRTGSSPWEAVECESITLQNVKLINDQGPDIQLLDGIWQMAEGGEEKDRVLKEWSDAVYAKIPGSVHMALYENGLIPEPVHGFNDNIANEKGKSVWWFRKVFAALDSPYKRKLIFNGVCASCTIWLNGRLMGSHNGMFGGPCFEIEGLLQGKNELVVKLEPAPQGGAFEAWQQSVVFNCCYGWHYVNLRSLGIWRSVRMQEQKTVRIKDPFAAILNEQDALDGIAHLYLALESDCAGFKGVLKASLDPLNFNGYSSSFSYPVASVDNEKKLHFRFSVPKHRLWWPNNYGEQNLYTLKLTFENQDDVKSDYKEIIFGIRYIDWASLPGGPYEDKYNWTLKVNGKEVFLKGIGWCTIDAMMDFSRHRYERFLSLARDANVNFMRAWGGGIPETDEFYDLCNRYGIMVMQEWPTAWNKHDLSPYSVMEETVRVNTLRLRNNPSLVMWCGGNESDQPFGSSIDMMGRYSHELDGTRPFHRSDPWGGSRHDYGPSIEEHSNAEYFISENTDTALLSEYGQRSIPDYESLKKFILAEDLDVWPIPEGNSFWHRLPAWPYMGWDDFRMLMTQARHFVDPKDILDFIVGTQISQATTLRHRAEKARTRWPEEIGNIPYKLNDVWPGISWSVIDWFGSPKMAYYVLQDAFAPLTAVLEFNSLNFRGKDISLQAYILDDNDELANKNWEIRVKAFDENLKIIECKRFSGFGSINKVKRAGEFNLNVGQTNVSPLILLVELRIDEEMKALNYYWTNYDYKIGGLFRLPGTVLNCKMGNGTVTVVNSGDKPAIGVSLNCPNAADKIILEDNYFWLECGESKTLKVNHPELVSGASCWNMK